MQQDDDRPTCPVCGSLLVDGSRECEVCGQPVADLHFLARDDARAQPEFPDIGEALDPTLADEFAGLTAHADAHVISARRRAGLVLLVALALACTSMSALNVFDPQRAPAHPLSAVTPTLAADDPSTLTVQTPLAPTTAASATATRASKGSGGSGPGPAATPTATAKPAATATATPLSTATPVPTATLTPTPGSG